MNDSLIIIFSIFCIVGLGIWRLTLEIQYFKVKKMVLERAGKLLDEKDSLFFRAKVDNLLGREVRSLCALYDSEFIEAVKKMKKG